MTGQSRFSVSRETTRRARQLRSDPTPAEKKLWFRIRFGQLDGLKFRRQHPVGPYILDFYCPALQLCIELDGDSHGTDRAARYDARRTAFLETKGITVRRFSNENVYVDIDGVVDGIFEECGLIQARSQLNDEGADGV